MDWGFLLWICNILNIYMLDYVYQTFQCSQISSSALILFELSNDFISWSPHPNVSNLSFNLVFQFIFRQLWQFWFCRKFLPKEENVNRRPFDSCFTGKTPLRTILLVMFLSGIWLYEMAYLISAIAATSAFLNRSLFGFDFILNSSNFRNISSFSLSPSWYTSARTVWLWSADWRSSRSFCFVSITFSWVFTMSTGFGVIISFTLFDRTLTSSSASSVRSMLVTSNDSETLKLKGL